MNDTGRAVKTSAWLWFGAAASVQAVSAVVHVVIGPADGVLPYLTDYANRALMLGILLGVPALRQAYRVPAEDQEKPDFVLWACRAGALSLAMIIVDRVVSAPLAKGLPHATLFAYPPYGNEMLRYFDLTVGLFLVALSEELLWRRALIEMLLKCGWPPIAVILVSAISFASIHWFGGIAQIIYALPFGILAGLIYMQIRSLALVVAIHYAVDLAVFGYYNPH